MVGRIVKLAIALLVIGVVFFGFAYWRGYSPADVLVRIQSLLSGGGTPAPATTAPATTVVEQKENPIVSAGKQALQVTRPARSQIWKMFEYEVGPGSYKFPIWTWASVLSVVGPVGFSILWALAKYFMGKAGVKITRPDNPKVLAISGVAVIAAILALWQLQKLFGWATALGLIVVLVYEFLLCTGEWTKFLGDVKNIVPGSLSSRDWCINLVKIPFLFPALVAVTLVAPVTLTNLMRPGTIVPAEITPMITNAASVTGSILPSWLGVVKTILPTLANFIASLLALVTVQFNGIVMLVELSALTAVLAARRIF